MQPQLQRRCRRGLLIAAAIAAVPAAAVGGSGYTLERHAIHAGGISESASANYQLSGTIGQPAPGFAEGGGHELHAGFWTPGVPANDLIFRNGFQAEEN